MAQRKEEVYKFDVSAKTVKIPGHVEQKNLVLITNVDRGQIIYSQFDPSKGSARSHEHIWPGDPTFPDADFPWSIDGTCVFTLDADLSGMADTDQLSILIDDYRSGTKFRPWDHGLDAVERMRVSNPQSLINTDFELGLQDTKWENIGYNRNHPTFYSYGGDVITLTGLSSDGETPSTITGTIASGGPTAGEVISIKGTKSALADGNYLCETGNGTSFTYKATGTVPSGDITTDFQEIRLGDIFSGATLPALTALSGNASGASTTPGLMTATFADAHGMLPGSPILVFDSTTPAASESYEGSFFVKQVINATQFTYETPANTVNVPDGAITNAVGDVSIYGRNASFATSRPFDGGSEIGTGLAIHGLKVVRQTKDYFRYQSGKGIFWSTAFSFKPTLQVIGASSDGSVVTITSEELHGLQTGCKVFLEGITTSGYYGQYVVSSITGSESFEATPIGFSAPGAGTAAISADARFVVDEWSGSSIRAGLFDDQNGMFWEFDGRKINLCRKSTTRRIAGTCSLSAHTVTGTGTKFTEQLAVNNIIVIRGVSFIVTSIASDTSLTVAPGRNRFPSGLPNGITDAVITKMEVLRIPQEDWNYDTCDGNGPSGFLLRPRYTSMVGINYSWYGSGYIDFMIRGPLGEWIKVHRMPNHNIYDRAYLRSGNLPGRYEITNCGGFASLDGQVLSTDTTIQLKDVTYFPDPVAGYPEIIGITSLNGANTETEVISYTGVNRTTNELTGCVRRTSYEKTLNGVLYGSGGSFSAFEGSNNSWTHPDGSAVLLLGTTFAGRLQSWGNSVSLDGGFDKVPGFVYSYKVESQIPINDSESVLAFRLCPAVSNSFPQRFGVREIINRQELRLKTIEITNIDGNEIEITGLLNPSNLGSPSYARSGGQTIGGAKTFQQTFTEIATAGGILTTNTAPTNTDLLFTFFNKGAGTTEYDLSDLKNLENSIQGGDNVYPDGPEVLLVYVTNLDTGAVANVDIVLRWEEAGA